MTTVTVRSRYNYQQELIAGDHILFADEPIDVGGDDTGPNPYELLLGALGTCTSITLQMYAKRKGWSLEHVEIELRHRRDHARDCEECSEQETRIDVIELKIGLKGDLDAEQRKRLHEIAQRCPVNQTLSRGVRTIHSEMES